jgi:hypothetical protein
LIVDQTLTLSSKQTILSTQILAGFVVVEVPVFADEAAIFQRGITILGSAVGS